MSELLAETIRRAEVGEIDLSICYFHVFGNPNRMFVGRKGIIDFLDHTFVGNSEGMLYYSIMDSPNGIISIAEIKGFFDTRHDKSDYILLPENPFPVKDIFVRRTEEGHYWNHMLRVTASIIAEEKVRRKRLDLVALVHDSEQRFSSIEEARKVYGAL